MRCFVTFVGVLIASAMNKCFRICAMLFGIRKRNELMKTKGKTKRRVLEEQPTIAATDEYLYKSGLVAQNALRWEKAHEDLLMEVNTLSIWAVADLSDDEPHFSQGVESCAGIA